MTKRYDKPHTLKIEDIKVSGNTESAIDVLRSAMPFLDESLEALRRDGQDAAKVEVPASVFRNVVTFLASEVKRIDTLAGAKGDKGDGDWNPFNKIDFEFD